MLRGSSQTWTVSPGRGAELASVRTVSGPAGESDPAAVRAILDEECAKGVDDRAITRALTRREANAIWGLTHVARRAGMLQRFMMYTGEPDGLAGDLARYRAVTRAGIGAALARWIDPARMVEIETVPGATAQP